MRNNVTACYCNIKASLTLVNLLQNSPNSTYFDIRYGLKLNTMKWDIIKTNAQYIEVLKRVIIIMDAKPGSTESKEREELLALLTKYERKHSILPELELMP